MHRFMSNYFESGLGFKLRYESTSTALMTTNQTGQCGGIFFTPNGTFTSPSYPDNYPNSAYCIYTISQPTGTVILLSILDMEIDAYEDYYDYYVDHEYYEHYHQYGGVTCIYDSLEFRDGASEQSPLIDGYCGNGTALSLPIHIQTRQNNVWIR